MKTVSLTSLKARLSEFLALVKAGEAVMVMERGKSVAKLIPIQDEPEGLDSRIKALEREGKVKIGTSTIPGDFWASSRPQDASGAGVQAILDERSDSR
jgi:prevent-host-death family protein